MVMSIWDRSHGNSMSIWDRSHGNSMSIWDRSHGNRVEDLEVIVKKCKKNAKKCKNICIYQKKAVPL